VYNAVDNVARHSRARSIQKMHRALRLILSVAVHGLRSAPATQPDNWKLDHVPIFVRDLDARALTCVACNWNNRAASLH
jgi:hypothetical protein